MAQDSPSRHSDQYPIRLPDGMRDRIKSEAKSNRRSMNAEIVARLEASFTVGTSLNGEVAALIQKHVDAEVQRRLVEIGIKISEAHDVFQVTTAVFDHNFTDPRNAAIAEARKNGGAK